MYYFTNRTQKRKAQNRAAQRAFRERKEQHLKNLETKVEELTKASEAANHENTKLRAQVDQMTTELKQYKQKLTVMANPTTVPREKMGFGNPAVGNLSDVTFHFNFPKFGSLPGPQQNNPQRSTSQPISPLQQNPSPTQSQANGKKSPPKFQQSAQDAPSKDDFSTFAGMFTPSMSSSTANGSRGSLESGNYSSPSASSHSNTGPSSSCGTSPEPFTQSPMGSKPIETMTTIGEEQTTLSSEPFAQFSNIDFGSNSNFDWLAQQHGANFDPQLFGDYREPQENVLSNPSFDDFFNDALDADFFTPYNIAPSPNFSKTTAEHPKKNLIDEIDAQKNDYDDTLAPKKESMNCNKLWYVTNPWPTSRDRMLTIVNREKLQECPKAQNGEFDLDGLCSELTKKAKCDGTGPVVGEQDFDTILKKYMGKDVASDCIASKLGIKVNDTKPSSVGMY